MVPVNNIFIIFASTSGSRVAPPRAMEMGIVSGPVRHRARWVGVRREYAGYRLRVLCKPRPRAGTVALAKYLFRCRQPLKACSGDGSGSRNGHVAFPPDGVRITPRHRLRFLCKLRLRAGLVRRTRNICSSPPAELCSVIRRRRISRSLSASAANSSVTSDTFACLGNDKMAHISIIVVRRPPKIGAHERSFPLKSAVPRRRRRPAGHCPECWVPWRCRAPPLAGRCPVASS